MSTFNPEVFEQTVVDQSSETKRTPIPPGEYTAYVGDKLSWREYDNRHICSVPLLITDMPEDVAETLGLDQPQINFDMWLDITDGVLEFGVNKNVELGRLREALGQNRTGESWNFSMLKGSGPVKITVEPDKKNPEMYSRITKLTAAA